MESTAYVVMDKKKGTFVNGNFEDELGDSVFLQTKDDNKPGVSGVSMSLVKRQLPTRKLG